MYNENEESLGKQAFEALKALISLPFLLITIIFNLSKLIAAITHICWKAADDATKEPNKDYIDVTPRYKPKPIPRIEVVEPYAVYEALPKATSTLVTNMYSELASIEVIDKVILDNGKYIIRFTHGISTNVVANMRANFADKYSDYIVSYRKGINTDRMYIQLRPR
ncbi:hypothetical protein PVK63_19665 [Aliivibrio sp. S2TY2]|uniref:hypothetical protein n=1 Tax=unclassified Aliivibrio TaxID=2645654 RepID=UPI002379FC89|nr:MULTISPECIES: hypothetical protein [unclassified Aliivibrio]MDD9177069.1 hypothetical protein [Aliivibrio sp. S3TY1]MDD9194168.1 hypothetical protein [Aliivibrio sp. S2TY2]